MKREHSGYVANCGAMFRDTNAGMMHERTCPLCRWEVGRDHLPGIIEAADCVVATLNGYVYGLTTADQLEALRMAARSLEDELNAWRASANTVANVSAGSRRKQQADDGGE